jgi:CHAT domain-containing protein/tetratricopeptide (TPR) repeat protein
LDGGSPDHARQLRSSAMDLVKKATRADLTKALRDLENSSKSFESRKLNAEAAKNYLYIGEIYSEWSKYQASINAYHRALRINPSSNIEITCSAYGHLAIVYADLGEFKIAQSYADKALAAAKISGNPHANAEALEASGEAQLLSSTPDKTLSILSAAADGFHNVGDQSGEARARLNAGYVLLQSGWVAKALESESQALELSTTINDIYGKAKADAALGLMFTYVGEPAKAVNTYREARQIFHSIGDLESEGATLNGMGLLKRSMGEYEESAHDYHQAGVVFAALHDSSGQVGAIEGEAKAEWALHHLSARNLFSARLRMAMRSGDLRLQASALSDLADTYEPDQQKAESLYLKSLELCRSAKYTLGEVNALISLAHLYSATGRNGEAVRLLHQVLKLDHDTVGSANLARTHYELAVAYDHQSQLETARDESDSATRIIEDVRTKPANFDTRASYFASVHRYYQFYIQVLMELEELHPNQGFSRQAFDAAERSKVRSLLDMLGAGGGGECAISQEPKPQEHSLKNCSLPVSATLTMNQIQNELDSDSVLLEYELGRDRSYLWALDKTGLSTYVLPGDAKISSLVSQLHTALVARQTASANYAKKVGEADAVYRKVSPKLSQMLLAPVWARLQGKTRIMIVPDGSLRYVAFSALPGPSANESHETLKDGYELVNLPSAAILNAVRNAPARHSAPTSLAAVFADPVFSGDDSRVTGESLHAKASSSTLALALRDAGLDRNIPRLAASRTEAEMIQQTFGRESVFTALDFEASRQVVLASDLGRFRYLHFATHGLLDTKHPALSGLVFSLVTPKGEAQDGYVRLQDIYDLKLAADLVVLSSCKSALGKDLESEGILGLPQAFLHAGAKRVISTLWNVDDSATAELMKHFYQRLHDGETPAAALRGAQSDLARIPSWNHPFYWAAFVLQGEYR